MAMNLLFSNRIWAQLLSEKLEKGLSLVLFELKFSGKCIHNSGVICKRFLHKSPAQSQKGKKRPPKHIRLLVIPGEKVDERKILGKQKTLKYHPGFNVWLLFCSNLLVMHWFTWQSKVGLDPKDKSLYSLCSGTVFYSIEKFNANPKSPFVQQFYSQQKGPVYKKYIHVIKDNNSNEFKLIDIIWKS